MKKYLLIFGLTLFMSSSTFAQEKSHWLTTPQKESMKALGMQAKAAPVRMRDNVEKVATSAFKAPKKVMADEVWYQRPEGTMYFSGDGYIYHYIPAFVDVTWKNMATDKANAAWSFLNSSTGNSYPFSGNDENDLEFENPKIDNGYISSFYIPYLTVGDIDYRFGDSFTDEPDVALINGDSLLWKITQCNLHGGYWTGFSNGYVFGTDSRTFTSEDGSTFQANANAIYEFYQKPIKPLYLSSLYFYIVSQSEVFLPEGTDMKVVISKWDKDNGIGETIDEMLFNINDTIYSGDITTSEIYKKYGMFEVKHMEIDDFGLEYQVPVIIDEPFVISIMGFDQPGVDFSLYMCDVMETESDFYETTGFVMPTMRSFVNAEDGTPVQGLRYCQYIDSETSKIYNEEDGDDYDWTRQYNALIFLNSMYDVVRVYDDFRVMTAPAEGGYVFIEDEVVEEDDDGNEVTNVYRYSTIQYQTTLPQYSTWEGMEGDENYYFEDLPDWLEVEGYDEEYYNDDYDYTRLAFVVAQPLPDGVSGRTAQIRIVSERGADSGYITIVQGEGGSSIATLRTDAARKANAKVYNLAGQQVSANYHGLMVKDGKKVFK